MLTLGFMFLRYYRIYVVCLVLELERCSFCFGFFFKGYNPRINSHKLNTTVFKIIYLVFLVALGLHCCAWAFSSRHKWDQHPSVVHSLLTAEALVVEHRLEGHGFTSSSSQAQ